MRIDVRGLSFEGDIGGPDSGQTAVLLHGFPQNRQMWDRVAPRLEAADIRTIAYDQRGYSPGARPEEVSAYDIRECVADLIAVLDALSVESAHVVGHDWGAYVAWHAAGEYPERVRSVTAVSVPHPAAMATAIRGDADQQARSSYIALFRQAGKAEAILLDADGARLRGMYRSVEPERVERYVAPMLEPGALTAALNWYRALDFASSSLGQIRCPSTLIWGDDDPAIGRVAAESCAHYVGADFRFVALEGVDHWIPDEHPEVVAEEVLARIRLAHPHP